MTIEQLIERDIKISKKIRDLQGERLWSKDDEVIAEITDEIDELRAKRREVRNRIDELEMM